MITRSVSEHLNGAVNYGFLCTARIEMDKVEMDEVVDKVEVQTDRQTE